MNKIWALAGSARPRELLDKPHQRKALSHVYKRKSVLETSGSIPLRATSRKYVAAKHMLSCFAKKNK